MSENHSGVRPRTAVLTRGFDPSLSVGSARPAVFRTSTYVFDSPEAAEHAFAITTGKIQPEHGVDVTREDMLRAVASFDRPEVNVRALPDLVCEGLGLPAYAALLKAGGQAEMQEREQVDRETN